VPEFVQDEARPELLAGAVSELLSNPGRRAEIAERFRSLREILARDADQRAAQAVLEESGKS
jgi:lipid-A-disaccharide synthase